MQFALFTYKRPPVLDSEVRFTSQVLVVFFVHWKQDSALFRQLVQNRLHLLQAAVNPFLGDNRL